MYKYTDIRKGLTFIPTALLEEESESMLIKWMLQGYKINVHNMHTTDDVLFCITKIVDYAATLPKGLKRLVEVGYTTNLPSELSSNTQFLQPTVDGNNVIIFQRIVYQYFTSDLVYMRYVGQNKSYFDNDCLNVVCHDCDINFSVSKDLATLSCDIKDGYVVMLYRTDAQDESGNFLIPDDNILWQALAYYAEAMHFRDRGFRKEENAQNMFLNTLNMANNMFNEFQKKDLLRKYDPDDMITKTQSVNQVAQVNAQTSTTNYHK